MNARYFVLATGMFIVSLPKNLFSWTCSKRQEVLIIYLVYQIIFSNFSSIPILSKLQQLLQPIFSYLYQERPPWDNR